MYLEKLQIQGIRNIRQADLVLSPGANLFYGLNGSGKTSILEAAHILSRGRSFRTRNLKTVINLDDKTCTCFGLIRSVSGSTGAIPIGVTRDDQGKFIFKINGCQVTTASQLAEVLPLQIINTESFQLLEGPPGARRSFIDWGVFHVEHTYRDISARFQKCLKHRNSLLRHGKIDNLQLTVWDREFSTLSLRIDRYRKAYLDGLAQTLHAVLAQLGFKERFDFRYLPGWDQAHTLEEQLHASRLRDQKAGFTHLGPHRADLRVLADRNILAADILSRGQIKALICGLKIAQGQMFKGRTGQQCIFLFDDLPSELDEHHRSAVSNLLIAMGAQVLVTGVDRRDLENLWSAENPHTLFHVEQGQVVKV